VLSPVAQHTEAALAARAAILREPQDADAWWHLASACFYLNDFAEARAAFEKVTLLRPDYAEAWGYHGIVLQRLGDEHGAQRSLEIALERGTRNPLALRALRNVYENARDLRGEYAVLKRIDEVACLDVANVERLAILHLEAGSLQDAARMFRRMTEQQQPPGSLSPRASVFALPELPEETEAIDRWHLCQRQYPGLDRMPQPLQRMVDRAQELARRMQNAPRSLLGADASFRVYTNPYELLAVDRSTPFDAIDAALIRRLHKAVLAEIELEDGHVSWLAGALVDRSHAIAVCEELNHERKRRAHWMVFQHPPLLKFLTHGEHALFNVEAGSLLDVIELIANPHADFAEWLSGPFSRQYGAVLAKAIETGQIAVLECMLQGRRWVRPEDDDACFEPARRAIEVMFLRRLQALAQSAQQIKQSAREAISLVADSFFRPVFRVLPVQFRDLHDQAMETLHAISLAAANRHHDLDLAQDVLQLAVSLSPGSPQWTARLREGIEQLELARARQRYDVQMTVGSTTWRIGERGVSCGAHFMPTASIASVRWGIVIYADHHDFRLRFTDDAGREIVFSWQTGADIEKQKARFETLRAAAVAYIVPVVTARLASQLKAGHVIQMGPCRLDEAGIEFTARRWFVSRPCRIAWRNLSTRLQVGFLLIVCDANAKRNRVVLDSRETPNAPLLEFLAKRRASAEPS
jgi:tetratricopeptide (TPR) repeat protein